MKKRLLSALLALSVLLGSMPVYALEETPDAVPAASAQEIATTETAAKAPAAAAVQEEPQEPSEPQDSEAASEEEQPQVEVIQQEVTVDTSSLPSNDELFAMYLQQQMYPDRVPSLMANWGRTEDVLNEDELAIYNALRTYIEQVAQGDVTSTEAISMPFEHTWTYAELGISGWNDPNRRTAVKEAFDKLVNLDRIIDCLLVDCPADLYWFDKTVPSNTSYSMSGSGDSVTASGYNFSMVVAQAYRADSSNLYSVDKDKTSAAKDALDKAQTIVDTNKDQPTTYAKLLAYKDAICGLTSYNHDAADDNTTPYGDPWQLINVFDGDSSTNVVCEGYAKAFQYLCDLSDIPCYTVWGKMQGGTGAGGHMWNIVPLDGKNYLVDVTNCDEGTAGAPDKLFLKGVSGSVEKGYVADVGSHGITYTYDQQIIDLYNTDILTLSETDYDPSQAVHTHSYDADGFCDCGFYQPAEEQNGVYQISNAGNFFWFAALVNGDATHAVFDAQDIAADAVLTQDINLQDKAWTAVGEIGTGSAYAGTFDGQGHSVSGLNPEGFYSSLFGSIDSEGVVENLVLAGVTAGSMVTGGIAYNNVGTIRCCGNLADLAPNFNQAGGIVNSNSEQARIENCYNLGNITGQEKVGGIAASNDGTITGCYSMGTIQSSQDSQYVGGIVGVNGRNAPVTNCYYLDTSASTGTGENSWTTGNATAKTQDAFTGGEVTYLLNGETPAETNVWRQNLDNGEPVDAYPVLSADHGIVYANGDSYSNTEQQQTQDQAPLTVSGWQQTPVYGDTFTLTVSGGSGSGTLSWTATDPVELTEDTESQSVTVRVTGVGDFSVTVTKAGDSTYKEASNTLEGTASARTLTVKSVTASNKTYDGNTTVEVTGAELANTVEGDDVALDLTALQATVAAADADTYDTIHLEGLALTGTTAGNYTIDTSCDVAGTVTIAKADPTVPTDVLTAEYGQTLSDLTPPAGWTWVDPETPLNQLGKQQFQAHYAGSDNYNEATVELTVEVVRKTITNPTVTLADGADGAVYNGQAHTPKVMVRDGDTILQENVDYTVEYRDNVNAGQATAVVTAVDTSGYTFETQEVHFNIVKASAPTMQDVNVQHRYTSQDTQTVSVANRMPADAGTLSYAAGAEQDDNNLITSWSVDSTTGTVTYTLSGQGKAEDTAVLSVTISSTNYADTTVQVKVTMMAKQIPTVSAEDFTREYNGKPVAPNDLTVNANGVPGSWTWKDLAPVNVVDSGEKVLIFTPFDADTYTSTEVRVKVTITKAPAQVSTAPQAAPDLTYNGQAQDLVTAGETRDGTLVYALEENGTYAETLPTATNADTYTVWYKVLGDSNHTDSAATAVENIAIAKADPTVPTDALTAEYGQTLSELTPPAGWSWTNPETPLNQLGDQKFQAHYAGSDNYNAIDADLAVTVTPKTIQPAVTVAQEVEFTGSAIEPAVEVRDGDTLLKENTDYTVEYSNNTNVGTATVTVTAVQGGNYTFAPVETSFTIVKAAAQELGDQTVSHRFAETGEKTLSLAGLMPTNAGTLSYTAGTKQDDSNLVTEWSVAADGTVTYTLSGKGEAGDTAVLPVTIASDNYADTTVRVVLTMAELEMPEVTADPYTGTYTGSAVTVDMLNTHANVPGSWTWRDPAPVNVADSGEKVLIFTPDDTETYATVEVPVQVNITKAPSRVSTAPQAEPDLTYNDQAQTLVTAGSAEGGTLVYALSQDGPFEETLPTAINADTYTVWYKVVGDANHNDTEPVELDPITIAKADPTVPTDTLEKAYGYKLSAITLPDGWEWQNPDTVLLERGEKTFPAYRPEDNNHKEATAELTVNVTRASLTNCNMEVSGTTNLTYDGQVHPVNITRVYLDYNPEVTLQEKIDYVIVGGLPTVRNADSYQIKIMGIGNFQHESSEYFTVSPKRLTAQVTAEKVYDGTTANATVTATVDTEVPGETLTITGLKGEFAQKDVGENLPVKVDSTGATWDNNQNYRVTFPGTATGTILPADCTYGGVADQTVKIGNGLDTVNLVTTAAGVPGETVQGTVTWYQDNAYTQPLSADYRFSGQEGEKVTLYWAFTPDPSETNYSQQAQYGSTDFTLARKATPQVSAQSLTKTYDGKAVTLEDLKPTASVPGSWALDAATPELKNAGLYNVVLHFTPDDARAYETADLTVTVKVEQRLLTVGVELSTNQITTQEALPTPRLVWSGAVEGEDLIPDLQPTFAGLPDQDNKTAGYYTIQWTNREEILQSVMAKPGASNYRFRSSEHAVLIVTQATLLPGSDETYRLEAREGLPYVPPVLQEAGFPTVEAVQEELFKYAAQKMPEATKETTAWYDVQLYYSADGGKTWTAATRDNFPAQGITVTLPYPDGTNASDFDFVVTHMLLVGTPGAVETPAVTETAQGLQFTVHSLSPIAVSWNQVAQTETGSQSDNGGSTAAPAPTATPAPAGGTVYYTCPACGYHDWTATDEGYRCDHCGRLESVKQLSGYGNVKGVYEPQSGSSAAGAAASAIAQTGDESHPVVWVVLMIGAVVVLAVLVIYRRKRNR